jgi:putative aldouronate transport system substrate-binding protein
MNRNRNDARKLSGIMVLLVLVLLIGCSNTNGAKDSSESSTKKPSPSALTSPLTIQILSGVYNEVPDMNNQFWTEWQKRTNTQLNIEWVPSAQVGTKMDLLLASGNLPEVLASPFLNRPTLLKAIKNGAFWDLTPFLGNFSEYPNLRDNLPPSALKYLTVDGKIYALPRSRQRIDSGVTIRKDWLDQLNIPVPTTLDEYVAALKKIVASDPAKTNTTGLIQDTDNLVNPFIVAGFGGFDPNFNSEGGLIYTQMNPGFAKAVEFERNLYKDGLMSKDFSVTKLEMAEQMFKTGRGASYTRSISWNFTWEEELKKLGQLKAQIMNLTLQGPDGNYAVQLSTAVNGGFYISKKVPEAKVKQLLKYLDYSASPEMTDLAYYGIEGKHYTMVDGQKQLTELGTKEVNTTSKCAAVLGYVKDGRVMNFSASKKYNDAKIEEVKLYDKVGKVDPTSFTLSETWLKTWPKYQKEFESMVTQAIVGQISMNEFKAYVDKLNNMPDFKQSYKEFAESYKNFIK